MVAFHQTNLSVCYSFNSCLVFLFHLNENWKSRSGHKVYFGDSLVLGELFSCSLYFLLGISVNRLAGWSWTYSGNWGRQCWSGAHLMPNPWQGEKGSTAGRVALILPRNESSWVYCNSSTSRRYGALSHRPCLKQPLGFQGGKNSLLVVEKRICSIFCILPVFLECWWEARLWIYCSLCRSDHFVVLCFSCSLSWVFSTNMFVGNLRLLCGSEAAKIPPCSGGFFNKKHSFYQSKCPTPVLLFCDFF